MTTTSEIGMPVHSTAITGNTPAAIATPIMDTNTNINNNLAANSINNNNIHNNNNLNISINDNTINSNTNSISTTPLPGSTPTPTPRADGTSGDVVGANTNDIINSNNSTLKLSAKIKRSRKKRLLSAHKSKQTTGYIIYASEIRKDIIKQYPNREFGDISKIVGIEWKNLPQETKAEYEKRAQALNAKYKALAAQSPQQSPQNKTPNKLRHNSADSSVHYGSSTCNSPYQIGSDSQTQFSLPDTHQQQSSNTMTHYEQNGFLSSSSTTNNHINNNNHLNNNYNNNTNKSFNYRSTLPSPDNASLNNKSCDVHNHQHHHNYANNHNSQPLNSSVTTTHQPGFICVTNDANHGIQQFRHNNIIYRKPAAVRLRPRDSCTQTEPIKWIDGSSKNGTANNESKNPLKFSQKFIEYLTNKVNRNLSNGNNTDDKNEANIDS